MSTDDHALLADLAVEFWKALRAHERTLQYVPVLQLAKVQAQIRFSASRLDSLLVGKGMKLVVFAGRYSPNIPATPVNGDEFVGSASPLAIERTVEPAVVDQEQMRVIRMGQILLRKDI